MQNFLKTKRELNRGVVGFILLSFFLAINSGILTKKKSIQERPQRAKQKEKDNDKRKRNKPTQKDHILGITIKPKQKQSNKFDIRLWNKTTPCKQRWDN